MMSSIRLQHYDVTSCKQQHLIVKHHCRKGVSIFYKHRKFWKVSFINEGVIAFSKKVHVILRHPVYHFYPSYHKRPLMLYVILLWSLGIHIGKEHFLCLQVILSSLLSKRAEPWLHCFYNIQEITFIIYTN